MKLTEQELNSIVSYIGEVLEYKVSKDEKSIKAKDEAYIKSLITEENTKIAIQDYKSAVCAQEGMLKRLVNIFDKLGIYIDKSDHPEDLNYFTEVMTNRIYKTHPKISIPSTTAIKGYLIANNFDPEVHNINDYIEHLYNYTRPEWTTISEI